MTAQMPEPSRTSKLGKNRVQLAVFLAQTMIPGYSGIGILCTDGGTYEDYTGKTERYEGRL